MQSSNISEKSIGSELRVPIYTIQRLQENINSCPKEDVLDQKIHIQMIHALIHKIDKGDSILATFTTNENRFTFQETNQIHVRLGDKTTDLEVNLTDGERKNVSLAPAIDEDA